MQAHLLPSLEAREISVRYDDHGPLQLEGVSITLTPGQLIGVIGPNGSGKSTLVRTLSRTLPPCKGSVLLDHADLYTSVTQRESARLIAVVPQSTDVFLDFTVRDIVAMGRTPMRTSNSIWPTETLKDRAAIDSALERMAIPSELAMRPISDVSGGERQRALIARMLAQESRFLLLDEPTAALDIRNESILLSWLRILARDENRGILVVLHDLNLACEMADQLLVLSEGRSAAFGPPETVMNGALINDVYGVRAWVRLNPATGRPTILPLPLNDTTLCPEIEGCKVHLFCGAGTGVQIMFELASYRVQLTASILHQGDSDAEAADFLGISYPVSRAFSYPDDDAISIAKRYALNADAAILTCVPIGDINKSVLVDAREFVDSGRRLIIFDPFYATETSKFVTEFERYANVVYATTIADVIDSLAMRDEAPPE